MMRSQKIPMEWMGPATWRLPSGKALAEFALQAGFLAPMMLANSRPVGRKPGGSAPSGELAADRKLTKVSR